MFGVSAGIGSAIAGGAASLLLGGLDKPQTQSEQSTAGFAVPPNPVTDPAALAEQAKAAEEERKRKTVGGYGLTNPTGGLGDASAPSLAAKSLLGA